MCLVVLVLLHYTNWGHFSLTHTTTMLYILCTQLSTHMLIFTEGGKLKNLEKNPHGTGENNTSNKLNSHIILPKLGLKPGTIEVRGQLSHHCATHATLQIPPRSTANSQNFLHRKLLPSLFSSPYNHHCTFTVITMPSYYHHHHHHHHQYLHQHHLQYLNLQW